MSSGVAICMATYNPKPRLLRMQLDSIRAQTIEDWVCYVSDDHSAPDLYDDLVAAIGDDERFVLSRNDRNGGFYRNFERALSMVPPVVEHIALSDQDDEWYPHKLEVLRDHLTPGVQLVYSDFRIVDEDGTVAADSLFQSRRNYFDRLDLLGVFNTVTGAATMFPADLARVALPFPAIPGHPWHDHWLTLLAIGRGEIAYVDVALFDHIHHGNNASLPNTPAPEHHEVTARSLFRPHVLEEHVHLWRGHYGAGVRYVEGIASFLRPRIEGELTPDKRRQLHRLITLSRSPTSAAWIASLALRRSRPGDVVPQRAGFLLRGILYRRLRHLVVGADERLSELDQPEDGAKVAVAAEATRRRLQPVKVVVSAGERATVFLLTPTARGPAGDTDLTRALALAARLAELGQRVRLVHVGSPEGTGVVAGGLDVEVVEPGEALHIGPDDTVVVHAWPGAHLADDVVRQLGRSGFAYLIDDDESLATTRGSVSSLARHALMLPHVALFSSSLLQDHFRELALGVYGGTDAAPARSAVVEPLEPSAPPTERDLGALRLHRLLFHAHEEGSGGSDLFDLGVLALEAARAEGLLAEGQWELFGFGPAGTGPIGLADGGSITMLGPLARPRVHSLLCSGDIGLALTQSPALGTVTEDMASAALVTVTTTFAGKTADRLRTLSPNLIGVEASVEGIVTGLSLATERVDDHAGRLAAARTLVQARAQRAEEAASVARSLFDQLHEPLGSASAPVSTGWRRAT